MVTQKQNDNDLTKKTINPKNRQRKPLPPTHDPKTNLGNVSSRGTIRYESGVITVSTKNEKVSVSVIDENFNFLRITGVICRTVPVKGGVN